MLGSGFFKLIKQAIRNGIIITTTKCCLKKRTMLYINNKDEEWRETLSPYRYLRMRKHHHSWGICPRSIKPYICEHISLMKSLKPVQLGKFTLEGWSLHLQQCKTSFTRLISVLWLLLFLCFQIYSQVTDRVELISGLCLESYFSNQAFTAVGRHMKVWTFSLKLERQLSSPAVHWGQQDRESKLLLPLVYLFPPNSQDSWPYFFVYIKS